MIKTITKQKIDLSSYWIFIIFISYILITNIMLFLSQENIGDIIKLEGFEDNLKNIDNLRFFLLIVMGIMAPTMNIFFKVIFLNFIIYLFNLAKVISKRKVILIAVLSYIPSLIGSIINMFATIFLGVRELGYTTLVSYIHTDSQILSVIYSKINPFEIFGVLIMGYLLILFINGNYKDILRVVSAWYIIDITISVIAKVW
ncbi:hypothetical protein [Bacillus sp. TL12]|uniref:hypothetical protein n=1 Tax=Bacillus sp. TL12 TaxID=2894756 RepID=UPI001F52326A|nr:hypothetical protein [Bacillus sp. TL12]MCI0768161.1 hypothetical protein [Bacillus sp. TL12]